MAALELVQYPGAECLVMNHLFPLPSSTESYLKSMLQGHIRIAGHYFWRADVGKTVPPVCRLFVFWTICGICWTRLLLWF